MRTIAKRLVPAAGVSLVLLAVVATTAHGGEAVGHLDGYQQRGDIVESNEAETEPGDQRSATGPSFRFHTLWRLIAGVVALLLVVRMFRVE